MKTPSRLIARGRGIFSPDEFHGEACLRLARCERGAESLAPLLAASPELASLLARLCIALACGDSDETARLRHAAESRLDALAWDWGSARPLINPSPEDFPRD